MSVQEIKEMIKNRIEKVPNKYLIKSYVFNEEWFWRKYKVTFNDTNFREIDDFYGFIFNEMIENLRDWYFKSKDYFLSLKVWDIIDVYDFFEVKKNVIITRINYWRTPKKTKSITSINYEYEYTREDWSKYKHSNKLQLQNSTSNWVMRKWLNWYDIKYLWSKIIRWSNFWKYDIEKYNKMIKSFIL